MPLPVARSRSSNSSSSHAVTAVIVEVVVVAVAVATPIAAVPILGDFTLDHLGSSLLRLSRGRGTAWGHLAPTEAIMDAI